MYLLIDTDGHVRVVTDLEEALDFLDRSPYNKAYGFTGWEVTLDEQSEEEVETDEPA